MLFKSIRNLHVVWYYTCFITMQSGALTLKEFMQWSMDHMNLSLQLATILFEVSRAAPTL